MLHRLIPHSKFPPSRIEAVGVEICMTDSSEMLLRYFVRGSGLSLPEWASPGRADELWVTTCFEMFLKPLEGEAYFEFNFSPSSQWAAYAFDGYRAGMRELAQPVAPFVERDPQLEPEDGTPLYALEADVDLSAMPQGDLRMSLSAVIEEIDGTKSYWALAHPPRKPDFHHDACFVLELPAADAA